MSELQFEVFRGIFITPCHTQQSKITPLPGLDSVFMHDASARDIIAKIGLEPRILRGMVLFNITKFGEAIPPAVRMAERVGQSAAASLLRKLGILCASALGMGANDLIFSVHPIRRSDNDQHPSS